MDGSRPAIGAGKGYFRADTPHSVRFIVTGRDLASNVVGGLVASVPVGIRVTIEDPWGAAIPADTRTATVQTQAVMVRRPGPVGIPVGRPGVQVRRIADADGLADAERVMVDGFPLPGFQPLRRGTALPARVLDLPGWDVWLATRDGQAAASGYTYDDGGSVGVYWLATLPDHRSSGLGRALLATALAGRPHRPATLVATDAGRPLYESMAFETVSTAVWYSRVS